MAWGESWGARRSHPGRVAGRLTLYYIQTLHIIVYATNVYAIKYHYYYYYYYYHYYGWTWCGALVRPLGQPPLPDGHHARQTNHLLTLPGAIYPWEHHRLWTMSSLRGGEKQRGYCRTYDAHLRSLRDRVRPLMEVWMAGYEGGERQHQTGVCRAAPRKPISCFTNFRSIQKPRCCLRQLSG